MTVTTAPPAGVPVLQRGIHSQKFPVRFATGSNTPLMYISLTFTQPIQLGGVPGVTLTAPSSNAYLGENVYLGSYEPPPSNLWGSVAGPAVVTGATARLDIVYSGSISVAALHPVTFAVYETGPASLSLSLANPLVMGAPSTDQVAISVRDQYGVSITGGLKVPIQLTSDDTTGRTALTASVFSNASQTAPLVFDGKGVRFTLTASEGALQTQFACVSSLPKENLVSGLAQSNGVVGDAAFGPDGNFWTTFSGNYGSSVIAKISPTGNVTSYTDTTPTVIDQGNAPIAAGSDGNIWTTFFDQSYFSGVLIRVTPSGAISEFPGPQSMQQGSSDIGQLVLGPDGAMWFTLSASDPYVADSVGIGRVDMSGHVSVVAATTNAPTSLVSGPDGNLWFQDGANIDKLTTSGALTKYTLPGATATPSRFVVGPDGQFWMPFAYGTKTLVEFSTSGAVVATHDLPSTLNPTIESVIASGNYVYFTDSQSESVGRIDVLGNTTWYPTYSGLVNGFQGPLYIVKGPSNSPYLSSQVVLNESPLQFGAGLTPLDLTLW
ncbi:MAG: hypothetical protein KGN02_13435 [bacterium]|nr:hypothetical protein [bacterium]